MPLHTDQRPGFSLLLIGLYVVIGYILFQIASLGIISFLFEIPLTEMDRFANNPASYPHGKEAMLTFQGITSIGTFILVPTFFFLTRDHILPPLGLKKIRPWPIVLVLLIILTFMVVNAWFIEFNRSITFPESLQAVEKWARDFENRAEMITNQLTQIDSFPYFIAALLVIAVVPGIGEELLFRGIVQKKFFLLTNNIHLSIWLSAAIFSAFHLQFFGFIPRLLLGVIFGYIYYWSGSLLLTMLAHFFQNGFLVLAMYLHQTGAITFDVESTESVPITSVLIFSLVSGFLIYIFRHYYLSRTKHSEQT